MADNDLKTDSKGFCLVAAIDFGTSLSGYAYSDVKTSKNTNPQIHHYQCWNKTGKYTDIKKTATCILFDEHKQFHSFGYDAKFNFANLQTDNQRSKYYFFKDFKMALYNHKIDVSARTDVSSKGKECYTNRDLRAFYRFPCGYFHGVFSADDIHVDSLSIQMKLS